MKSSVTLILALITLITGHAESVNPSSIPEADYVTVNESGQLSLNGKRIRFWAVIGNFPNQTDLKPDAPSSEQKVKTAAAQADADALVRRFEDLGFNLNRMWHGFAEPSDYTKGDGSRADVIDYFIAKLKKRGMKIWLAGMNRVGDATPEDVNIINDPSSTEDWKKAVLEGASTSKTKKFEIEKNLARIWDPRLQALAIRDMKNIATHFNKYTGLRWCDDPVFAVWELSNEEWWIRRMVNGGWQKLPQYFQNDLIQRWNLFLKSKYQSSEVLVAAWKSLDSGEDLTKGTITLQPMAAGTSTVSINDASQAAADAVASVAPTEGTSQAASSQRGADVLEFFLQLQLAHKTAEAAAVKSWGRSTKLSPLIFDTGIGYEIQSQYLHQQADAIAHDAYVNGIGRVVPESAVAEAKTPLAKLQKTIETERQAPNSGPWNNWLLKPPGICQGVPWLEHNRFEGKPFFCYETQIQQPAKYRADFPLRIAALASIQDWDVICWHYFGEVKGVGSIERPFDQPLDITTGGHPQGYHYTYDEVQNAMMRAAAWIFRDQLLGPAANPTKFIFGRKSLFDPASMEYAGSYGMSGMDMLQTVYQYGVRIEIDPKREDDEVIGPVVSVKDRNTHNPYTPTPQITFDWKKGFLRFDASSVSAFTGLLANYGTTVSFASGVSLEDVKIVNPSGSFDPIREDERYIAFAAYTEDGKSFTETRKAYISLVSTSFNTGFLIDPETKKVERGTLPVLVSRVGGKISAPFLDGMTYILRDWHLREIGRGRIDGGSLTIPVELPVFVVELNRT